MKTELKHNVHSSCSAKRLKNIFIILCMPTALYITACAPAFSEMQSAKTVGKGNVEITPHYSSVHFSNDGETNKMQNNFGIQATVGLSDRVDLRFRYEHARLDIEGLESGGGINEMRIGPKMSLLKDRVALSFPVGLAFGNDIEVSETFGIYPTLLLTAPVNEQLEINGSAKVMIPIGNDSDVLTAYTFGPGFSTNLARWAIRPEIGILLNPGEDGAFLNYGIGLSLYR